MAPRATRCSTRPWTHKTQILTQNRLMPSSMLLFSSTGALQSRRGVPRRWIARSNLWTLQSTRCSATLRKEAGYMPSASQVLSSFQPLPNGPCFRVQTRISRRVPFLIEVAARSSPPPQSFLSVRSLLCCLSLSSFCLFSARTTWLALFLWFALSLSFSPPSMVSPLAHSITLSHFLVCTCTHMHSHMHIHLRPGGARQRPDAASRHLFTISDARLVRVGPNPGEKSGVSGGVCPNLGSI